MAEQVNLTVAETKPSNNSYSLERFTIDLSGTKTIHIQLKGQNGEAKSVSYNNSTNPTAATLISNLNTSNNSAGTSLVKRIYNRLIADGHLSGTVSGTPD